MLFDWLNAEKRGDVSVVVGGQYGSEAKGAVTAWLARRSIADNPRRGVGVIRVAGPNAGHTAYDANDQAWALRQIPVGMVVDPRVVGFIAPGSEVDLRVLIGEIIRLEFAGINITDRLFIDQSVTLLTDEHHDRETGSDLNARAGSTAKGIGAARSDRLMRTAVTPAQLQDQGSPSFREFFETAYPGMVWDGEGEFPDTNTKFPSWDAFVEFWDSLSFCDTTELYRDFLENQGHLVIEGTQGYGLGLHGDCYPQTTSQDCRAVDFLAQAGISPWASYVDGVHVWVCARVYPIRVQGNSGPLKDETTWEELGLPPEHTTVTKKVRRVGLWDGELVRNAVLANGGSSRNVRLALTMVDQMFPVVKGETGYESREWRLIPDHPSFGDPDNPFPADEWDNARKFVEQVERETGANVGYIGTGPNSQIWTN